MRAAWGAAATALGVFVIVALVGHPPRGHEQRDHGPSASSAASAAKTADTVPWSDRTDVEPWVWPAPAARVRTTACRGAALRLDEVNSDGATGHLGLWVRLVNRGTARCTIAGFPVLSAVSVGRRVTLHPERATWFRDGTQERPATIDPGESAMTVVETSQTCEPQSSPTSYAALVLALPDGTRFPTGRDLSTTCPLRLDDWSRSNSGYVEPPARYPGLSARLETPDQAVPGTRLRYVVILANQGHYPVALGPCPGYDQTLAPLTRTSLAAGKPIVHGLWRLRCDAVPTIPPGASVRFKMELPVPDTDASELLLTWGLHDQIDLGGQVWLPVRRS